jgi:hypothetical protein
MNDISSPFIEEDQIQYSEGPSFCERQHPFIDEEMRPKVNIVST